MKIWSISLILEKCKSKLQSLHTSQNGHHLETINAGEGMEKTKLSYTLMEMQIGIANTENGVESP